MGITGAIAGCSSNSDSPEENSSETANTETPSNTPTDTPPDQTPSDTPTDTPREETPPPTPEATLQLETMKQPELPGVWTSEHSLEDFETVLQVTAQTQNSTAVGETTVEDDDNEQIDSWPGNTPTLQETTEQTVAEMQDGENTYTARNQKHDLEDTATAEIQEPENFLLDLQPANTENSNSPVFTTYNSPSQFTHDKKEIDLNQLEEWHDNDYTNLKEDHPEMETFVESIDGEGGFTGSTKTKIEKTKNNPSGWVYPNSEKYPEEGKFIFSEENEQEEKVGYKHAESAGEALDWLHPYLLSFEYEFDTRPISSEDEKFAAIFQECFDQYNDNFNAHTWAFDLESSSGGTHGNGLIYDQTNDELRVLETVTGPVTAEFDDPQLHPLIENSNYLNKDHDAHQRYWHPLRFDGTEPEADYVDFREGKGNATQLFRTIATGFQDMSDKYAEDVGVVPTTNYIEDIIDTIRNYNEQDQFNFEKIKNQSKVYNKLMTQDENYVVGGTADNPLYAQVDEDSKIEEIWSDPDGTIEDYVDDLEEDNYQQITASKDATSPNQLTGAV
jgi:hypothetical protein